MAEHLRRGLFESIRRLPNGDEMYRMIELPPGSGVEEHPRSEERSFVRGLVVALPLALIAWLLFFLIV